METRVRRTLYSQISLMSSIASIAAVGFQLATHYRDHVAPRPSDSVASINKDSLISTDSLPGIQLRPGQTIRVVDKRDRLSKPLEFTLTADLPEGEINTQRFLQGYAAAVAFRDVAPFL